MIWVTAVLTVNYADDISTPVPGTTAHPAVPPNQKIFPFAILLIINFTTTPLTP
jgi:hypothetical protein